MANTRSKYKKEGINLECFPNKSKCKRASQTSPGICEHCVDAIISNKPRSKPVHMTGRKCKMSAITFFMFFILLASTLYILTVGRFENQNLLMLENNAKTQSSIERKPENPGSNILIKKINVNEMCDYAQESLGGRILGVGSTELFHSSENSLVCAWSSQLAYIFCNPSQAAAVILQPQVLPGKCWAIKGSGGSATIKLYDYIFITGVTVEHIPKSVSPTKDLSSAPKKFSIHGLVNENDEVGINLGIFSYDIYDPETTVQYFEIPKKYYSSFKIVRFEVLSNWGNKKFTCIYRIRIHGNLKT